MTFEMPARAAPRPCSAPSSRVSDDSGWGVMVQIDEDKAYARAIAMRNQSFSMVAIVARSPSCSARCSPGEISRPVQKLARGRAAPGRRRLRHARRACAATTRSGSSPTPSTRWARRSRRRSRRSAGGPRRTRSCSWARSACSPTRSTRRTPTRAATRSASPTTPRVAKHLGMAPEEVEQRPPLGHHPRRRQDRDRGQDPAQGGGAHRRGVRDHEAAPDQGRAHPGRGAAAQADGGRRA